MILQSQRLTHPPRNKVKWLEDNKDIATIIHTTISYTTSNLTNATNESFSITITISYAPDLNIINKLQHVIHWREFCCCKSLANIEPDFKDLNLLDHICWQCFVCSSQGIFQSASLSNYFNSNLSSKSLPTCFIRALLLFQPQQRAAGRRWSGKTSWSVLEHNQSNVSQIFAK